MADKILKSSSDLWFSAYLMLKGIKLERYEIIGRGKGKYFFDLSDSEWVAHKLSFNNSELVKYKTLIEQLKDLLF